jgi:hypothetical protein
MINPAETDTITGTVKELDCIIISKVSVKYKINDLDCIIISKVSVKYKV